MAKHLHLRKISCAMLFPKTVVHWLSVFMVLTCNGCLVNWLPWGMSITPICIAAESPKTEWKPVGTMGKSAGISSFEDWKAKFQMSSPWYDFKWTLFSKISEPWYNQLADVKHFQLMWCVEAVNSFSGKT